MKNFVETPFSAVSSDSIAGFEELTSQLLRCGKVGE